MHYAGDDPKRVHFSGIDFLAVDFCTANASSSLDIGRDLERRVLLTSQQCRNILNELLLSMKDGRN